MENAALLCLATRKGHAVLQAAAAAPGLGPLLVCTFKETHVAETYDDAIRGLAQAAGIPVAPWKAFRDDPTRFLDTRGIRSILCIGWRYLIPDAAVAHLGGDVVVAHDALLPKLRGFAPTVTAMIAGESETGVTFLRAGPGVDDGPILWQRAVPIGPRDTIAEVIERLTGPYVEGALRYLRGELADPREQDERQATYSIWRDPEDYRLDWSQDAARLERTVRALGPPYLGAQTTLGGQTLVVHEARVEPDLAFAIRQPGKIWSLDARGRPTVVCGAGLLTILRATAEGRDALPLKSLRQRFV